MEHIDADEKNGPMTLPCYNSEIAGACYNARWSGPELNARGFYIMLGHATKA